MDNYVDATKGRERLLVEILDVSGVCDSVLRELETLIPRLEAMVGGVEFDPARSLERFRVALTDHASTILLPSLVARIYRGSLNLPGRRRPVRHLVAVSAELAATRFGAAIENNCTILMDNDPVFVL